MTPVILRVFKNDQLVEVKQFDVEQILIGSEGDVGLRLPGDGVSSLHCLIERRAAGFYLSDLGSQTGTLMNSKQVLDEEIGSGESFLVGPYRIQFFVGAPKAAEVVITSAPPAQVTPSVPASPTPVVDTKTEIPILTPIRVVERPTISEQQSFMRRNASAGTTSTKTFAPPSHVGDLKTFLKGGKGDGVQVLVAWRDRVLESYNFLNSEQKTVSMGDTRLADVYLPGAGFKTPQPFLLIQGGTCQVHTANADSTHIKRASGELIESESVSKLTLEQGELICLSYGHGDIQVFVRHLSVTAKPLFAPLMDFSSGELTGIVISLMIVGLSAIYIAMIRPSLEDKKPEPPRLAQFVYTKTVPPVPEKLPKEEPPPPPPVVKPPPTPPPQPPKKVKVTEEKVEAQKKGNKESKAAATERPADRAAEVRPNPNATNRPKKFTSVKQGGAVKLSDTASSNAQSKDPNQTGLLAAFGAGGSRSKLDQAYAGQGALLGMADKSTGTSGQNENRAGDDLGSKFKEAGAGGKGTATQGISGVGTKGRGSGQSAYGGLGYGGKGSVAIDAGGSDAEFVGSIDREAVRRVIRSILTQIKSCYERQLRANSALEGKIIIQFEIEAEGRVRVAKTKSSNLNDSTVESCVASRIKEQRFPEPPPGVTAVVDYPFVFGAQK